MPATRDGPEACGQGVGRPVRFPRRRSHAAGTGSGRRTHDGRQRHRQGRPEFSGTNSHEKDADEPDIVKTDGRRIVTVDRGTLRVVDAASRQQTGKLDLGLRDAGPVELLLAGNVALVLAPGGWGGGDAVTKRLMPTSTNPQLISVDLSGAPRVVSRYRGQGSLIDARLTGSTARVVLRTTPRVDFPAFSGDEDDQLSANRRAIGKAPLAAWLPSWEVTTGATTEQGQADCGRVSRPADYSGGALVSVLTFDLTQPALGNGDAVTIAADSDTVYATGSSLYLASDQRWRLDRGRAALPVRQETDLYHFTLTGNQPPVYAAAGNVPGFLINQYALSEWNGHLRVAATNEQANESAVYVLRPDGDKLVRTGFVAGLGKNERIYSVRFLGPRGYVVTFRQTDPLYSLDLADPTQPKVTGELKITGYSAHLQPAGDGRLIGVGQEADPNGRVRGTQVSLFDVTDPTEPRRLAQHHTAGAQSEAEWDPHALLWWPATSLLVVPISAAAFDATTTTDGVLALQVTDAGMRQIGFIGQPAIRRSLVIDDTLWTVSDAGLQASLLSTMEKVAWLPHE
ncbi:beta-propeller domain-containing protein [Actinoplanes sp. NPDC051859]|uniref:beta-propeller domain-containing protein n=1 Tax=Actinoplanes sp. NPDC051859 TaxID=3363909 RepID=UPI003798C1C4